MSPPPAYRTYPPPGHKTHPLRGTHCLPRRKYRVYYLVHPIRPAFEGLGWTRRDLSVDLLPFQNGKSPRPS